jgi:hypothetical protein
VVRIHSPRPNPSITYKRLTQKQPTQNNSPSTEIANTRSAPLFRNSKFSFGSTARLRGSTIRSSSINLPRRLPSDFKREQRAKSVSTGTGDACNEKGHCATSAVIADPGLLLQDS